MADPAPHPRDSYDLDGIEAPAAAFEAAMARGRLHHAWLLTGPEGVGKASFAYRAARRLLGARPDPAHGPLGASPEDTVSHLVASQAHPDLMILERAPDKKSIPVDEARRLPEFFAKAPALGPFRVAIVDAADDLNVNAANAVLKTLEEPPPRGVIFMVSHAPGRLLPTIRSRCRRLAFVAWPVERLADYVEQKLGLGADQARRVAEMAKGAPGRARTLAAGDALAVDAAAAKLLASLPDADEAQLIAIADGFRGGEGMNRFALLFERLADQIHVTATARAGGVEARGLDAWAAAWEQLQVLPVQVEALNLDRADAFWTAMAELRRAARVQPLHG